MKGQCEGGDLTRQVTKEAIIKALKKIGVKKGDHLGVGLSFKSIGYVEGGPEAFIDALLEVVGSNGTVMMPTFTSFFDLSLVKSNSTNYCFDYTITPAITGLVPETFRKRKNAVRSKHPTNSVASIGKLANYLTENHDSNSPAYLPYSKLAKVGGKILSIGLGDRVIAIVHEAQYQAGLLKIIPFRIGVKYRDDCGDERLFIRKDKGGCTMQLCNLVSNLRKMKLVTDGCIGTANTILLPAKEYLEYTIEILNKKPTINLCSNILCLWCREIERRLNLFKNIENPKNFQKKKLLILGITLFNYYRLRRYILPKKIKTILNRIKYVLKISPIYKLILKHFILLSI